MNNYILPMKYEKDPQQKVVITLDSGKNLVLAPAGCGKTDILAERISFALAHGVQKEDMLNLTFTNRASREMIDRVSKRLGQDMGEDLFIGNIHRYCIRLISKYSLVPHDTTIIDSDDAFDILKQLDVDEKGKTDKDFYKTAMRMDHVLTQYRSGHDNSVIMTEDMIPGKEVRAICETFEVKYTKAEILWMVKNINKLQNDHPCPDAIQRNVSILGLADQYASYKESHRLMDFDDVLILTYTFLTAPSCNYQKKQWIQVDEVQDLNALQLAIVDQMADENATILYLGDERQAIFSFLGARQNTLERLKGKCDSTYHLGTNYRSAKYLTEVFNEFAIHELNSPKEGGSHSGIVIPKEPHALSIRTADLDTPDESGALDQYTLALQTAKAFPDVRGEKTAVIVPTNKAADIVSEIFHNNGVDHFKVSGTDFFSSPTIKLLLAHLCAIHNDFDFMSWSRLVWKVLRQSSNAHSRTIFDKLRSIGMLPQDMLCYEESSYVLEFLSALNNDVVVFDTETTGLDVFNDEILQLAALKIRDGKTVGRFNVFLEGDASRIPPTLKGNPNPLFQRYHNVKHLPRQQALESFLDFVGGATLIGHNVEYDYRILDFNLKRDCGISDFTATHPSYFDTLKLSKLLVPGMRRYNLETLVEGLQLAGKNTHLADDDVFATVSLVNRLRELGVEKTDSQRASLSKISSYGLRFRERYLPLYLSGKEALYRTPTNPSEPILVTEMKRAYSVFLKLGIIEDCEKFDMICSYLSNDLLVREWDQPLKVQLDKHLKDICTLKEVDLCSSEFVKESYFISTIHKAKGLGFDNVIVTDVTEQTYPAYWNRNDERAKEEDARKLNVAMTRAKKRLCLIRYKTIGKWSRSVGDSPFINHISRYFEEW